MIGVFLGYLSLWYEGQTLEFDGFSIMFRIENVMWKSQMRWSIIILPIQKMQLWGVPPLWGQS